MVLTRELETLFFILIASAIGIYVALHFQTPKKFNPVSVVASLPHFVAADPTPTPVVTSPVPKVTITSGISSDGVEKITLKTTENINLSTTYNIALINTTTNVNTPLFTQTISGVSSMSIPFNVFSSDNSYLFLKVTLGANDVHFLVFKTDGTAFADGKSYVDITPLFSAYTSTYAIGDVTGWASPDLLVINTKKTDGLQGPSFWLEASSKNFIPLSTLFE